MCTVSTHIHKDYKVTAKFSICYLFPSADLVPEQYDEIKMLLEDIFTFNKDMDELKQQEKQAKQKQVESNKRKAEESNCL